MAIKEFQCDFDILQRKTPSHFGLFSSLNESFAPEELMPLLTELLNLADKAFSYYTPPSGDSVLSSDSSLLIHFLALKPVRSRGTYKADKGSRVFDNPCTKKSGRHSTLLPCIF